MLSAISSGVRSAHLDSSPMSASMYFMSSNLPW
jgi:hypothetical protein